MKMNEIQFLIYAEDGQTEVLVQDETLWATQKSIAELFSVSVPTINEHLKNIFESGELEQNPTIRKFRIVYFYFVWILFPVNSKNSTPTVRVCFLAVSLRVLLPK